MVANWFFDLAELNLELLVAFNTTSTNLNTSSSDHFWKCDPLEIWILAGVACWVELGRADAI